MIDARPRIPRAQLIQQLDTLVSQAKTSGQPLSILALDLDHFKPFEDQSSAQATATALENYARCLETALESELKAGAVLACCGGDLFVLLLPKQGLDAAVTLADRLRSAVQEALTEACLTVSVGVATSPAAGVNWRSPDLLALADARMAFAKKRLNPHHNLVWAGALPSDWYLRLEIDASDWPSLELAVA